MKTKDLLKQITEFKQFASKRAFQKLEATDSMEYCQTPMQVDFYEDRVEIQFIENRNTRCPDYGTVKLTIGELELSDEQWNTYVTTLKVKYEEELKNADEEWEKTQRERKLDEFNRLKQELGIE